MYKKIIILIAAILIIAVGLVVWQRQFMPAPNYTGPVETIRLATAKTGPELSNLIWIADKQGYFKDEGLNVEITQETNGVAAQEKVAAGNADIATDSDFGFVSDSFTLDNLRILASIDQAQVVDIVARKDSGINIPSDLIGKKVGLAPKVAAEFFFGQYLTANNILPSQVNIINTPIADQQQAIVNGNLDAVVTNDPYVYNIKTALGKNGIDWPAQGGQNFYWLIISSSQFLKTHPEAAARFLKSLVSAENFLKANPEQGKQIVKNKLGEDQNYFDQNWPKHMFGVTLDQSLLITVENEARGQLRINLPLQSRRPITLILFTLTPWPKPNRRLSRSFISLLCQLR